MTILSAEMDRTERIAKERLDAAIEDVVAGELGPRYFVDNLTWKRRQNALREFARSVALVATTALTQPDFESAVERMVAS